MVRNKYFETALILARDNMSGSADTGGLHVALNVRFKGTGFEVSVESPEVRCGFD